MPASNKSSSDVAYDILKKPFFPKATPGTTATPASSIKYSQKVASSLNITPLFVLEPINSAHEGNR